MRLRANLCDEAGTRSEDLGGWYTSRANEKKLEHFTERKDTKRLAITHEISRTIHKREIYCSDSQNTFIPALY